MDVVTHWDDLPVEHHELGPMSARWRSADGVKLGMSRIEVLPGAQSTPAHLHTAEEELFYVLGGEGLWWEDGTTTAIGPTTTGWFALRKLRPTMVLSSRNEPRRVWLK